MKKLSFVVPCYHSHDTIRQVADEIRATVVSDGRYDYEIILVNDNPPDETWAVITDIQSRDNKVIGLCFSRNFGQHSALMAGYRVAEGDVVVSLDDDGQTPPAEMFKLIDALDDSTDIAYAKYPVKRHSMFRNFGSKVNDVMTVWLLNKPKDLYLASYYAAKRFVIEEMIRCQNPYPYVDGLALRSTCRVKNIPIDHCNRTSGSSGYTFQKLMKLWLNGLTSFSEKPLRVSTLFGAVMAFVGLLFAILIVVKKVLMGDAIDAGWSSLITIILVLNGSILMMMGLMGEYIGRIYVSMNGAPQYVVLKSTKKE